MKKRVLSVIMALALAGTMVMSVGAQESTSEIGEAVSVYEEGGETVRTDEPTVFFETTFASADDDAISVYGELWDSVQWQVLVETNKQRLANDLHPLSMGEAIQDAANTRAQELLLYFDHIRPDGSNCFTVLSEKGISYSTAGENIAGGYPSPSSVVTNWMNSEGHRANILNRSFVHLGAGYADGGRYGNNWVQLFTGGCSPDIEDVFADINSGVAAYRVGTSIDDMQLVLATWCDDLGYCFIPVAKEMCNSFNVNKTGVQTLAIGYNGQVISGDIVMHPFKDVGHGWYTEGIMDCYVNGYMTGVNNDTFGTTSPISRAQFASILHRMNGSPKVEYTNRFKDVKQGAWYTEPVLWASSVGVVNGYNSGNFGPANDILREQMAVMMFNYAKYKGYDTSARADLSKYPDAKSVSSYASEAMKWAVGSGVITGKQDGKILDPLGSASRAECATIIMRFTDLYEGN